MMNEHDCRRRSQGDHSPKDESVKDPSKTVPQGSTLKNRMIPEVL
jgi:hypothetical protein